MKAETKKPRVRTQTFARVKVLVEVPVGSWGSDCLIDQVHRQSSEEALNKLRRLLDKERIRVCGVMSVEAITTTLEDRDKPTG